LRQHCMQNNYIRHMQQHYMQTDYIGHLQQYCVQTPPTQLRVPRSSYINTHEKRWFFGRTWHCGPKTPIWMATCKWKKIAHVVNGVHAWFKIKMLGLVKTNGGQCMGNSNTFSTPCQAQKTTRTTWPSFHKRRQRSIF